MIKTHVLILTAIVVLSALVASAQKNFQPSVVSASKLETSLPADILNYFSGNWSGKGKFTSGKEIESDFSFIPDLENQCILVRHKERAPNTFQFIALWSVDSNSGELVMLLASNHAAGARVFRSNGWNGAKIVFQSAPELRASFALERFTFERESATSFRTTYEMSRDNGQTWRVGDKQVFVKKPSR